MIHPFNEKFEKLDSMGDEKEGHKNESEAWLFRIQIRVKSL